ncbi:KIR protein [Plasmodium knowlesi strain H]|uniref:KIR protein n=3 Tax=Plasmodium knowlesi TaxID=5850 RepID=A0A5K1V0J4_PLAKH|nr:KIR protein [Plasmodium knowlesi strain H]OTN66199.1 KIR protein [Plasmodium knowlesi]CAA9986370.1 KIR protein [Plasmodium knowlesi strain H]SBO25633.1 KIR protein [Plasmodium knowlesi strain H]SBO28356.1 KIR protein [Plasmodium knowlesi strain H]VVS75844.1 KIR protein [Plasmodium knowlesi strain H]|eukprot:XP_002257776.1 KIR protein [Plasmodium knowlesi strain H]
MTPKSGAPDLKNLPSKTEYYDKFGRAARECRENGDGGQRWKNELKSKLNEYRGRGNLGDMIAEAYCYACNKKEQPNLEYAPCRFFYYWMENYFPMDSDDYKLSKVLENIYPTLKDDVYTNECKVNYKDDVPRVMFQLRKIVHDFSYDYSTIENHKSHYGTSAKDEYIKYLQKVGAACTLVGVDCRGGKHESGTYCDDFNNKYEDYCEGKLQELRSQLRTTDRSKESGVPDRGSLSDTLNHAGSVAEGELDTLLPSKKAYGEIGKYGTSTGGYFCGDDDRKFISEVQGALGGHSEISKEANKVTEWFCYPLGKKDTLSTDDSPCHFLYYFLGDSFSKEFKDDTSFWSFMNTVSEQLGKLPLDKENKCKIDLSHFKKDLFIWERRVYAFYKDRETIHKKLEDAESPCSREMDQYLTEAAIGYNLIDIYCSGNTSKKEAYCSKFRSDYEKHKPEELLGEKCPSILADELSDLSEALSIILSGESEEGPVSARGNPIFSFARDGPIASSGLAAVGLPAIAYFLYKYTSLPFWLREHFGGRSNRISSSRRRTRRSTGPDFSNFTEDVSTEMPTEYSSYLSTLYPLEESLEDNSTTYYEEPPQSQPRRRRQQEGHGRRRGPPRGRERTGNEYRYGSGQNISYFRM